MKPNIETFNKLFLNGIKLKAIQNTNVISSNRNNILKDDVLTVEHIFKIDDKTFYLFENCLTSIDFDYLCKNFIPYIS